MIAAALAIAVLAAAEAPDWFRVHQYAAKPAAMRGCSECQGEPDDLCEVRPGAQARSYNFGAWCGVMRAAHVW